MTAADRRKLSRHHIWCGEARTGLVSKLRRRLMSLEAGSRVGASPKTPDGYARESSRRAKSDPWCHLYDYMAHHDCKVRAISAFLGLSAHRARHSWQPRKTGQAQPAGIGACSGALAGSYCKSMGGQCGSSWARRSEHVEVTLSGWRSVWMESDEPALTQKSWLRTLYFTALRANFRSRPRPPARKNPPPRPVLGLGRLREYGRTSVHPRPQGGG